MVTWYTNTLLVVGPKEDTQRFETAVLPVTKKALKTALSLRSLSPGQETYARHVQRWSTPWDIRARLVAQSPDCLDYTFKSAVAPPLRWLRTASVSFPTLHFVLRYESTAARISGIAQARGGIGDDAQNRPGRFFFLRRTSVRQLSGL